MNMQNFHAYHVFNFFQAQYSSPFWKKIDACLKEIGHNSLLSTKQLEALGQYFVS